MAMDGIALSAVRSELESELVGARIEKIYQPERDELMLTIRGKRLLLSANASGCRVQFTEARRTNPESPPMFCMLLRKHLTGARVTGFSQPGFDRILHMDMSAIDELGEQVALTLITEIMGKHSNIVLVKNGVVIDSIRHVTPAISSVRILMPGVAYEAPPPQCKLDLRDADEQSVYKALLGCTQRLEKAAMACYSGVSPAASAEIAARAHADAYKAFQDLDESRRKMVAAGFARFFEDVREARFSPTLTVDAAGNALGFFPYSPSDIAPEFKRAYPAMWEAMDAYYVKREKTERIRQKGHSLQRILQNNVERCQKKLAMQRDILKSTEKMEENRLFGELLTANHHAVEKGARTAVAMNYYDENCADVSIPLDPALSPAANAQRYYKKYNKQKAAYDMAGEQISAIESELAYLEGQLENLTNCTEENELAEIREELIKEGYAKPEKGRKRPPKIAESKPFHYVSSDGTDIFVGKNNLQNDRLTLRDSSPTDIWLHTKNIPGSHVIIKSDAPSEQTLREAATLAAWHSRAQKSAQVPVDYTPRKYVKKPSGSRPGFVIYTTNRTMYVTPDEDAVKSLKLL